MKMKSALLVTTLIMSFQTHGSSLSNKIDSEMVKAVSEQTPGCNIGVVREGKFIHKKGYGLANLELDVPLDGNQVHRMASVSKQFTAMAVLLLADEGKISLDGDIRDYLPGLPDYGTAVTVRAMLGHTSGMGDYDLIAGSYEGEKSPQSIDLKSVAGGDFRLGNEDYLTINEFYQVVKTVPLAIAPNQEFRYSNLAYFLLSMLVEEVSGKSLRDYAQEKIFAPLGMHHTFFSDDPVEIVKNRAYGYKQLEDGTYVTDMTNLFWVGDGGLHTNLDDLLIWNNHFYQPQLGKEPGNFIKIMNTPNSQFESSPNTRYANGQFVANKDGQINYSHSGGWLGTFTYFARYPASQGALMLMCNDVSNPKLFEALKIIRQTTEANLVQP